MAPATADHAIVASSDPASWHTTHAISALFVDRTRAYRRSRGGLPAVSAPLRHPSAARRRLLTLQCLERPRLDRYRQLQFAGICSSLQRIPEYRKYLGDRVLTRSCLSLKKSRVPLAGLYRGYHVIRKEAGPFYRTSSSVRLWWEFKEPKGPKGGPGGI